MRGMVEGRLRSCAPSRRQEIPNVPLHPRFAAVPLPVPGEELKQ